MDAEALPMPSWTSKESDALCAEGLQLQVIKGCRIIENTFGIFSQIQHVVKQGIQLNPDKARRVVLVCV